MDVSDCFYQFQIKEMASWFGIDYPKSASVWGQQRFDVGTVYDEDLGRHIRVGKEATLYPVIGVMPMGWTWALFFANETIAHLVREASLGPPLEMRERLPVPQLWEAPTVDSTYVDNVALIGARKQDVTERSVLINKVFEEKEIPIVWSYEEPVQVLETVGCIVDFEKKILRHKPHRLWRVHLAGLELARRSKVRRHSAEVWLGHATSLFRLAPFLLSIFDKIYRFIRVFGESRVPLWPAVRKESLMAQIWYGTAGLTSGPTTLDMWTLEIRLIRCTH